MHLSLTPGLTEHLGGLTRKPANASSPTTTYTGHEKRLLLLESSNKRTLCAARNAKANSMPYSVLWRESNTEIDTDISTV